ncbi:MAG: outer membrane protein assembly factor BamA, partial [Sedimenticola sp.]
IETPAVPGSTDQVDVNVSVIEKPMGNLLAGLGYSQSSGLVFTTSISQRNFLGTGKRVNIGFDNSDANTNYTLGYTNPYYTVDGISRGFTLSYRAADFDEVDTAKYLTDTAVAGVNFGIPISETERVGITFDLVGTDYKVGSTASTEISQFSTDNGDSFVDFKLGANWTRDSRDSALLPTKGSIQRLWASATIPGSDLEYYKISYKHKRYFPVSKATSFALSADLGYGDVYGSTTRLPYWENYFGGGVKSVRGFKDYSLGPRDSNNDPLGGNFRLIANAELFYQPGIKLLDRSVRLGWFLDAGNVYDTSGDNEIDLGELRYSTGVSALWLSPMGALGLSFGLPLNDKSSDDVERFQFTFGTTF